jgi:PRC-barrel domain
MVSNATSNVISSTRSKAARSITRAGEKLGSIDDLMIDKVSGQVRYAVLEFGGFLGMGTDRYPIPWKVLKYSTDKGGYVVPLDKTRLDKAPKYAESSAPVFDEDYGSRINTYYERF